MDTVFVQKDEVNETWIDFEKEIAHVLDAFSNLFDNEYGRMNLKEEFWKNERFDGAIEVVGVNEEKLVDFLYAELLDLKNILSLYINEFIEKISLDKKSRCRIFWCADSVINFNYTNTNTFSELYDENIVVNNIYGNAEKSNIVLGINDYKTDQLPNLNLRFVKLKNIINV